MGRYSHDTLADRKSTTECLALPFGYQRLAAGLAGIAGMGRVIITGPCGLEHTFTPGQAERLADWLKSAAERARASDSNAEEPRA